MVQEELSDLEAELRQRNREIAQVRDKNRQREQDIEDWRRRHNDLVKQHADLDGEHRRANEELKALKRSEAEVAQERDVAHEEAEDFRRRLVESESARKADAEASESSNGPRSCRWSSASANRGLQERLSALGKELIACQTRLRDVEVERAVAACAANESGLRLARLAAELQASKESSLAQALQAFESERKLRDELQEGSHQAKDYGSDINTSAQVAARIRILEDENQQLRQEAGTHRRCRQELLEELATTREEASVDLARLRKQLEETRRARGLEMQALIAKLSTPARSLRSSTSVASVVPPMAVPAPDAAAAPSMQYISSSGFRPRPPTLSTSSSTGALHRPLVMTCQAEEFVRMHAPLVNARRDRFAME